MSGTGTRIVLDWGYIQYDANELENVSTVDDPSGLRIGKVSGEGHNVGRSLGKISFSRVRLDGVQDEVVLIQGKRRNDNPNDLTGELYIGINAGGGGDKDMIDVALIHHDGIEFLVPISAPGFGQVAASPPPVPQQVFSNKLVSPDGTIEMDIQNKDAYNVTVYDNTKPPGQRAIFDFNSIMDRIDRLEKRK